MEKDPIEPKAARTESGDAPPGYGETEVVKGNIGQRIFDSFRQNPNAKISHNPGADGNTFDAEMLQKTRRTHRWSVVLRDVTCR